MIGDFAVLLVIVTPVAAALVFWAWVCFGIK